MSSSQDIDKFELLRQEQEAFTRSFEIVEKRFPNLPVITKIIVAGDFRSAMAVDARLEEMKKDKVEKIDYLKLSLYIGSYARLDWLFERYKEGKLPKAWLTKNFPSAWSIADPDDTNPEYLKLWKKSYKKNGNKYLRDGEALPRKRILTIYRGQFSYQDPLGMSWSLKRDVAQKFADGVSFRIRMNGVVVKYRIERNNVLGYLTGRGEFEVICDPDHLIG